MNAFSKLIVTAMVVFVGLQFVRPGIPAKASTAEPKATPEVNHVLEKQCYSCHSDERRLSWFDQIVPAYWIVRRDILKGREHLNFSTLGSKPLAVQRATLFEAVNMVQLGAMPLPDFVRLHPGARVTPEELTTIKTYLAPWGSAPGPTPVPAALPAPVALASVSPELNGFSFDPDFENWKPISTTDRGDNDTFRFILGNNVAVNAAQSGKISPWPDSAKFAKVAWSQELGPDGLMHPGKFVQVELMLKNSAGYKDTEGWGWGRWRGLDLKPYGQNARFVNECTTCHLPMRGDDYVYTLPISTAKGGRRELVNNHAATLPASLPYQPLNWDAITMYVDRETHTTATLYGNDAAVQSARRHARAAGVEYRAGAVLALVTWAQREDPHWFGGRIPDIPQSVEFVEIGLDDQKSGYRRFVGPAFGEDSSEGNAAGERTKVMLGLQPVQLP